MVAAVPVAAPSAVAVLVVAVLAVAVLAVAVWWWRSWWWRSWWWRSWWWRLGGLLDASTPSAALIAALRAHASSYRWVAAAVGSNNAAGVQLATGDPVMAIGGFNGTDPAPTLAQFQAYVAAGEIHYFIGGGGFGGNGGSSDSRAIAAWVAANFTAQTIGGTTVYDLSSGQGAS